jgi:hypothetical protein
MLNINPYETRSPLCIKLAGNNISFDDSGCPVGMPPLFERMRIVAEDAVACTMFFEIVAAAVQEHMFGFKPGQTEQTLVNGKPYGVFGPLQATFMSKETSGCGATHAHGCFKISFYSPIDLHEIFHSDHWHHQFFSFLNAIMTCWNPPVPPSVLAEICSYHPNIIDPVDLLNDFCKICHPNQTHEHTHTCRWHGCQGCDGSCGMNYNPRLINLIEFVLPNGGFLIPQNDGMMVSTNITLCCAICSNSAIYIFGEDSANMNATTQTIKGVLKVDGKNEPKNMVTEALVASIYTTDYSSKDDLKFLDVLSISLGAIVIKRNKEKSKHNDDMLSQASWLMSQALNQIHKQHNIPSPLAAQYLLGYDDYWLSFQMDVLIIRPFIDHLLTRKIYGAVWLQKHGDSQEILQVNQLKNYLHFELHQ